MSLKDEFNIPKSTWEAMVKKGVISCAVVRQDEIISKYNAKVQQGVEHTKAVALTADEEGVSITWVYKSLRRYK